MRKHIITLLLLIACLSANAYQVGDVITNPDGSMGVVFYIHPNGSGGWMVALTDEAKATGKRWGDGTKVPGLTMNAAALDYDGYANTQAILDYQGANADYIVQNIDFANGWYLPAIGQLAILYGMQGVIANSLTSNGGQLIMSYSDYISSSDLPNASAQIITYNGYQHNMSQQYATGIVRAVKDFTTAVIPYDSTITYRWSNGSTAPYITVSPSRTATYTVTATSSVGCEATASQTIIVNNTMGQTINAAICEGETYTQYGFNATAPGTYNTNFTQNDCTVPIRLNLTVNPAYRDTIRDTLCLGDTWREHGFTLTPYTDGLYAHTFHYDTQMSCDSTITIELFVLPTYKTTIPDSICQHEPYNRNGFHIAPQEMPGMLYDTLHYATQAGCDSIFILELFVKPVDEYFISDVVHAGHVYNKNGFNISIMQHETGARTETLTLKNRYACDSIIVLNLNIIQGGVIIPCRDTTVYLNETIYVNEGYYENGFSVPVQTSAGFVTRTLPLKKIDLCDSTVILNLTVLPLPSCPSDTTVYLNETIHVDEGYNKNGFSIPVQTSAGFVTRTLPLKNSDMCDSIVILYLTVLPLNPPCPGDTTVYRYDTICQHQPYIENGFNLLSQSVPGVKTHRLDFQTVAGCDSIVILELTVNEVFEKVVNIFIEKNMPVNIAGIDYNHPATVRHTYISAAGCDSTITSVIQYSDANSSVFEICNSKIVPATFFSPNGDGVNDLWTIENIENCEHEVSIYDRFGKRLLHYKNNFTGWDGVYSGSLMPSTDYWYVIVLEEKQKAIVGHFTLVR